MPSDSRRRIARALAWGGAASLAAFEALLFLTDWQWIRAWFYLWAWWSFIPMVDGIVYLRRRDSLLLSRRRELLLLIPASFLLWLLFELANLRLENWHYVGVEPRAWIRWPGYLAAFGTVLPGIFEVYELLGTFGLFARLRMPPARVSPRTLRLFALTGWAFLVLPFAVPQVAFPLIWGSLVFLLEPACYRAGVPSLLRDAERGEPGRFLRLLAAGAACGLLWEFWNFWALAKWRYTVPFVGDLKLFEMPVAGFLGFPPFAVECYVAMRFVGLWRGGRTWEGVPSLGPRVPSGRDRDSGSGAPVPGSGCRTLSRAQWLVFWLAAALFAAAVCRAIDLWTIKEYLSS